MGSFPQSFLSIVWLDKDMYLGRYDLSWPYDVHLVTLMFWSKMAENTQITGFPILSIWEPCSSHFSVLCPWIWTFVPKNQAYYRLAIYILPLFSSPVSYCHGWGVRPSSVVRGPSSVVRLLTFPFPQPDLRHDSMDIIHIDKCYDLWWDLDARRVKFWSDPIWPP